MSITQHEIVDRREWLAMRRHDVTASAAAALVGCHPYLTAYALWMEKTGATADTAENPSMQRGRLLEPVAIKLMQESGWNIEPHAIYYRDTKKRIGATPDAIAIRDGKRIIVQVKSVEYGVFRRNWRNPDTDEVTPPLWIAIQAIVEAKLTGCDEAVVAAMIAGHGLDLHVLDIPLHDGLWERICREVEAFWDLVASERAPDPDYGRDADLIAELYRDANPDEEIDLSRDNRVAEIVTERIMLSTQKTGLEKRLTEIRSELLTKIGTASLARLADGRVISARTITRSAHHVAESSYRELKIKEPRR